MTRETSIAAFREIEAKGLLSKSRFEIYSALYKDGPCTGGELFQKLNGWQVKGSVCARLHELKQSGCVSELGVKKCNFSGLLAIEWDVNKNLPRKVMKKRVVHRKTLMKLLLASYDEMRWCHDSLFKQVVNGHTLSKTGMNWLKRIEVLMDEIESNVSIEEEKENGNLQ